MLRRFAIANPNKKEISKESDGNNIKYDSLNSEINLLVRSINFKLDFNYDKKKNLELLEKVRLILNLKILLINSLFLI